MELNYRAGTEGKRIGTLKVGGFSLWAEESQLQKLAGEIEKHLKNLKITM